MINLQPTLMTSGSFITSTSTVTSKCCKRLLTQAVMLTWIRTASRTQGTQAQILLTQKLLIGLHNRNLSYGFNKDYHILAVKCPKTEIYWAMTHSVKQ